MPREGDHIVNPLNLPMSMYEEGSRAVLALLPSSSNTNTGDYIPSDFFMESRLARSVTSDIYDQWHSPRTTSLRSTTSSIASSIEYMQDVTGGP
ncbi:MAG: hypothetical protein R2748_10155 [Bryobacterales bacterium]